MAQSTRLTLSKHEGAGNDFLVYADVAGAMPLSDALARRLCDRRFGVGADGLIRIGPGRDGAELSMQLRNADGGVAETSGNGLRCLAQAAIGLGLVGPAFTVATDAGARRIEYTANGTGVSRADVEMGEARITGKDLDVDGRRARSVDMGNPHLVVWCDDLEAVDLEVEGRRLAGSGADERNVEFVALGPGEGELSLIVWERGVGPTLACGTGTCAAAVAAAAWGFAHSPVRVHNPGGPLDVTLADGDRPLRLAGPVRKIADVSVDLEIG